jgi:hypothetical protein
MGRATMVLVPTLITVDPDPTGIITITVAGNRKKSPEHPSGLLAL